MTYIMVFKLLSMLMFQLKVNFYIAIISIILICKMQ